MILQKYTAGHFKGYLTKGARGIELPFPVIKYICFPPPLEKILKKAPIHWITLNVD